MNGMDTSFFKQNYAFERDNPRYSRHGSGDIIGSQCLAGVLNHHSLTTPTMSELQYLKENRISFLEVPLMESILGQDDGLELSETEIRTVKKIQYTLRKIERVNNAGWNSSNMKMLPLGDYDYVRRDLPVYKSGFEVLAVNVLRRPKGGMLYIPLPDQPVLELTKEEKEAYIVTEDYGGLLCLSFNTDHCMNDENFRYIPLSKKINRIKYLRDVLWSKDKFCKSINNARRGLKPLLRNYAFKSTSTNSEFQIRVFNSSDLEFTFPCWIMPGEYKSLYNYAQNRESRKFIAKPRSLGAGKGIYIFNDLEELSRERRTSNLIQSYLNTPHLIYKENSGERVKGAGYKWDMRTYVLVTSVVPFRGYIYNRGLVRLATSPYDKSKRCDEGNKTSCLTNTSINKKTEGAQLKDITWSLYKLRKYLGADAFDTMFRNMKKVIGLTMISAESAFRRKYVKDNQEDKFNREFLCQNCYQLLGVDILVDEKLRPKVVEVNGEPSLKTTSNGRSHYDITKKNMAKDLVKLVYNTESSLSHEIPVSERLLRWAQCVDLNKQQTQYNAERGESAEESSNIIPFLGKDDLEYMLDTLREHQDMGGFKPIYPSRDEHLMSLFEDFLFLLGKKERNRGILDGAHFNGRRLSLHRFMYNILRPEGLKLIDGDNSNHRPARNENFRLRGNFNGNSWVS